jgi:frataxin
MSVKPFYRASGAALRNALRGNVALTPAFGPIVRTSPVAFQFKETRYGVRHNNFGLSQTFHSSPALAGLMPESSDPPPKQSEASETPSSPTHISTSEYNKLADAYLEELQSRLERELEERQDIEVDFAAGILEVSTSKGVYVFNKQPPNKQIWLSSPESGPMRFDWVVTGESLNQKEGGGKGDWVYLREGISLTDLVRKELGVELGVDNDAPH